VVTAARQDIDFTSLDLDASRQYRIELFVVPNAAENQTTLIFFNGDETEANYQRQFVQMENTSQSIFRSTGGVVLGGYIPSTTTRGIYAELKLMKVAGAYPVCKFSSNQWNSANLALRQGFLTWLNTANVTSIKLRHSTHFGAGTVARLYED